MARKGKIIERTIYDKNDFTYKKDYIEINLYNRKNKLVGKTKIDKEFRWVLEKYKIGITHGYAECRKGREEKIMLHHLVTGGKTKLEVDHINCVPLDNRRKNLRFATRQENSRNTRKKGYYFDKRIKKYVARIKVDARTIHIGCYEKEIDAYNARKKAEKVYFKEFSFKN